MFFPWQHGQANPSWCRSLSTGLMQNIYPETNSEWKPHESSNGWVPMVGRGCGYVSFRECNISTCIEKQLGVLKHQYDWEWRWRSRGFFWFLSREGRELYAVFFCVNLPMLILHHQKVQILPTHAFVILWVIDSRIQTLFAEVMLLMIWDGCRKRHYLGDGLTTQNVNAWSELLWPSGKLLRRPKVCDSCKEGPTNARSLIVFFSVNRSKKKSTVETIIDGTILIFVFSVCFTTFLLFSVVSSIFRFDVKSWLDDFMSAFLMRNGNDDFSK